MSKDILEKETKIGKIIYYKKKKIKNNDGKIITKKKINFIAQKKKVYVFKVNLCFLIERKINFNSLI